MSGYPNRPKRRLKYIGSGLSRNVYDLGNGYVLKIAKPGAGVLSNRTEVNLYHSKVEPIKKYLAKIKDYDLGYRWIVMKKYSRKFPNSPHYRKKLMKIIKLFMVHGIIPSHHYSKLPLKHLRLKSNNQIVIIDYGGFRFAARTRQ